jgi:hypothetical protein
MEGEMLARMASVSFVDTCLAGQLDAAMYQPISWIIVATIYYNNLASIIRAANWDNRLGFYVDSLAEPVSPVVDGMCAEPFGFQLVHSGLHISAY